jgi:hypothetical protein
MNLETKGTSMIRQLTEAEQAERGTFQNELGQTPRQRLRKPDRKAKNAGKRKRKAERHKRQRMLKLKNRLRSIPGEMAPSPVIPPANRFGESGTLHGNVGPANRTAENGTLHPPVGHVDQNGPANSATQPTAETSQGATPPGAAAGQQPHMLADYQTVALMALLRGESNTDAARAAGVDQRTIYRWRQLPAFQAEMHRIQSCVATSLRKRAASMAEESIKVISEKLSRADLSAALGVLKATRILSGQPLSEIDGLTPDAQPDPAVVFRAPLKMGTGSAQKVEFVPENASAKVPVPHFQPTPAPTEPPICGTADSVESQRTPAPVDISDLLPPQQVAIAQLLSGKVAPEAAKEAGVAISTLDRWMKSDAAFRRILADGRREQVEALQTQLLNLSIRALDVLEFALKKLRNQHEAFALLHGVGVIKK